MPTAKKSLGRDRARVSSQKHELRYAAKKIGGKGALAALKRAKSRLGRVTSRKKVMAKAKSR